MATTSRAYSEAFKLNAIKFYQERDITANEAARKLAIPSSTMTAWLRAANVELKKPVNRKIAQCIDLHFNQGVPARDISKQLAINVSTATRWIAAEMYQRSGPPQKPNEKPRPQYSLAALMDYYLKDPAKNRKALRLAIEEQKRLMWSGT
jgi:transposase-like protein